MKNDSIKPCPFCGGKADCNLDKQSYGYFIACSKCHCSTPLVFSCGEPPSPVLLGIWNRRAILSRIDNEKAHELEKQPCGECHLKPNEVCDICGAVNSEQ